MKDGDIALYLEEYDEMNSGVLLRWQKIGVKRGDRVVPHATPIGPSAAFANVGLRIIAFTESDGGRIEPAGDTVGDLKEIAHDYHESKFMDQVMAERAGNSTLVADWHKFREMRRAFVKANPRTTAQLLRSNDARN